ncbi:hypothetical protein L195_g064151, partial [Trifolium pratense]
MEDLIRIFCSFFKSSSCHDDKQSCHNGKDFQQIFFKFIRLLIAPAETHRG